MISRFFTGHRGPKRRILATEFTGEVAEVGDAVTELASATPSPARASGARRALQERRKAALFLPPGLRPVPLPFGRAGAEGGSWEGGSEELRELRLRGPVLS